MVTRGLVMRGRPRLKLSDLERKGTWFRLRRDQKRRLLDEKDLGRGSLNSMIITAVDEWIERLDSGIPVTVSGGIELMGLAGEAGPTATPEGSDTRKGDRSTTGL